MKLHRLLPSIAILSVALITSVHASDVVPALPQARPIALRGATIHPVSGPEIAGGTIVFEKGCITAVGADVAVPPDDAKAFAKAVRRLVESPGEARRMGEAGRRFIEGWAAPAAVAEAYESLFEELSERSRAT